MSEENNNGSSPNEAKESSPNEIKAKIVETSEEDLLKFIIESKKFIKTECLKFCPSKREKKLHKLQFKLKTSMLLEANNEHLQESHEDLLTDINKQLTKTYVNHVLSLPLDANLCQLLLSTIDISCTDGTTDYYKTLLLNAISKEPGCAKRIIQAYKDIKKEQKYVEKKKKFNDEFNQYKVDSDDDNVTFTTAIVEL